MSRSPKRVLHVVGGMVRAGVETWLMHVLRRIDPLRVRMDFLVHTDQPCAYDGEIQERNSHILRCTALRSSPAYTRSFAALLRQNGPYDAVHSHVHRFTGYLLWLARRAGVPLRIAHSHSDTSRQDRHAGWMRGAYQHFGRRWILKHATHLAGASRAAGRALFGVNWDRDVRKRLLHCGIDLDPFRRQPLRSVARASLGIAPEEFVIGHTGRFGGPKNHPFLVEVFAEVALRHPRARLLLIGDGPARPAVEQRLRDRGLYERTIFAGIRPDVPELLRAMDVFVFPSLWEGLPLTVLEAQAAGLPCILSDIITCEADAVPGLMRRIALAGGAACWASEVLASAPAIPPAEALAQMERSSFNILHSVEQLYALYDA